MIPCARVSAALPGAGREAALAQHRAMRATVDEVLRVLDSMQMTARHRVATPANWKQGDDVIIAGSVTDEEAKKLFPDGWKTVKPYLRVIKQPGSSS